MPDADDRLQPPAPASRDGAGSTSDLGIAQWAYDHAESAGLGTDTLPASPLFYLPLVAPMRTRGVLAIAPRAAALDPDSRTAPAARHLRRAGRHRARAGALHRGGAGRAGQHGVRTLAQFPAGGAVARPAHAADPAGGLVRIAGALEAAAAAGAAGDWRRRCTSEALRMSALVANLLDMARLQSGEVKLQPANGRRSKKWSAAALRLCAQRCSNSTVSAPASPPDLPLVRFDAVLIERVLCNLLENAAKYTPPGSRIDIAPASAATWSTLTVADDGPGVPAGREEADVREIHARRARVGHAAASAWAWRSAAPSSRRTAARSALPAVGPGRRRLRHHAAAGAAAVRRPATEHGHPA